MKNFLDPAGKLFRSRGNMGNLEWLTLQLSITGFSSSFKDSDKLLGWSLVQPSLPSIPVHSNGGKKESDKVKL